MSRRTLARHVASHDCSACGGAASGKYVRGELNVSVSHRDDCPLVQVQSSVVETTVKSTRKRAYALVDTEGRHVAV